MSSTKCDFRRNKKWWCHTEDALAVDSIRSTYTISPAKKPLLQHSTVKQPVESATVVDGYMYDNQISFDHYMYRRRKLSIGRLQMIIGGEEMNRDGIIVAILPYFGATITSTYQKSRKVASSMLPSWFLWLLRLIKWNALGSRPLELY